MRISNATKPHSTARRPLILCLAAVALISAEALGAPATGWLQTSGEWDYLAPGNWVGGLVNETFDSGLSLTGALTLDLTSDRITSCDLRFSLDPQGYLITLDSPGAVKNLTLAGNLLFTPATSSAAKLRIGSTRLDLGGATRVIETGPRADARVSIEGSIINGGLVKQGPGTLELWYDNKPFAGGVELRSGSLVLQNLTSAGTGPISITGDSNLVSTGYGVANPIKLGANVTFFDAYPSQSSQLDLRGAIDLTAGQRTVTVSLSSGTLQLGPFTNGGVKLTSPLASFPWIYLRDGSTHAGGTTIEGTGVIVLGKNSFGSGPLTLGENSRLSTNSTSLVGANAIPNAVALNGYFRPGLGGYELEFSGPVDLGAAQRVVSFQGGGTLTFGGVLGGGGSLYLQSEDVDDPGTLQLKGVNTFTGGITLTGTRVALANKAALGTGPVRIDGASTILATTDLTGANAVPNNFILNAGPLFVGPLELTGAIDLNGAERVFRVGDGTHTNTVTIAGGIFSSTGTGSLTLGTSSGGLLLAGQNTYTGPTKITDGVLYVGGNVSPNTPGPLGVAASAVTIAGNTLTPPGLLLNGPYTFARDIVTSGLISPIIGSATADISSFTGAITFNNITGVGQPNSLQIPAAPGSVVHFAGPLLSTNFTNVGKTGAGTVSFEAANSYNGPTQVLLGTLLANNVSGSATGTGNLGVSAGTLGGIGTISGSVTIGDTSLTTDSFLAPGQPGQIGTLHTGAVSLRRDGAFVFELDSTAFTSDHLVASGALSITLGNLTLTDLGASTLADGLRFVLFENTSATANTGFFANAPVGAVLAVGLNHYTVEYNFAAGADGVGNDIAIRTVPEPGVAALLLAAGACTLGLLRRRPAGMEK